MTLDINPGDLNQHQLALYFADYDKYNRTESVTIYNGNDQYCAVAPGDHQFQEGKVPGVPDRRPRAGDDQQRDVPRTR